MILLTIYLFSKYRVAILQMSEKRNRHSFFKPITQERIQRFNFNLNNVNWGVSTMNDTNRAYTCFQLRFLEMYENPFPLQKNRCRKKLKSWMTEGIINSIKHKNRLYKTYIKNPTSKNLCAYKLFRNKLNTIIKVSKANFYKNKFEKAKNSAKNTWDVINSLLK